MRKPLRRTHTFECLRVVGVSDSDHQGKEVHLTESSDRPLHQAAATAAADRGATPSVPQEPVRPGLPALQLVLTATLQRQSQTLVTLMRHKGVCWVGIPTDPPFPAPANFPLLSRSVYHSGLKGV